MSPRRATYHAGEQYLMLRDDVPIPVIVVKPRGVMPEPGWLRVQESVSGKVIYALPCDLFFPSPAFVEYSVRRKEWDDIVGGHLECSSPKDRARKQDEVFTARRRACADTPAGAWWLWQQHKLP